MCRTRDPGTAPSLAHSPARILLTPPSPSRPPPTPPCIQPHPAWACRSHSHQWPSPQKGPAPPRGHFRSSSAGGAPGVPWSGQEIQEVPDDLGRLAPHLRSVSTVGHARSHLHASAQAVPPAKRDTPLQADPPAGAEEEFGLSLWAVGSHHRPWAWLGEGERPSDVARASAHGLPGQALSPGG